MGHELIASEHAGRTWGWGGVPRKEDSRCLRFFQKSRGSVERERSSSEKGVLIAVVGLIGVVGLMVRRSVLMERIVVSRAVRVVGSVGEIWRSVVREERLLINCLSLVLDGKGGRVGRGWDAVEGGRRVCFRSWRSLATARLVCMKMSSNSAAARVEDGRFWALRKEWEEERAEVHRG